MESFQEQLAIYTNKKKQDHSFKQSSSPSPRVTNEAIGLLSGRQRTTSKCCSISYATGSLQLCNLPFLDGAPLHIHYLWPVFVVLSALSGLSVSPIYACYSFVLGGPILFGSVLIHEFGHAYMALRLGGKVDKILLWPLGGLAYISFFGDSSPYSDALIAIAGPLTHIPMVLLWILLMYCTNHGEVTLDLQLSWGEDFWISLCAGAIAVQISLFCFNLIPAFPLDGGRLFGAWMSYKGIDRNRSFHWMSILGGVSQFLCETISTI